MRTRAAAGRSRDNVSWKIAGGQKPRCYTYVGTPSRPGGTLDSSPAVHCWVHGQDATGASRVATAERMTCERIFGRPYGTSRGFLPPPPAINRWAIFGRPYGAGELARLPTSVEQRGAGGMRSCLLPAIRRVVACNYALRRCLHPPVRLCANQARGRMQAPHVLGRYPISRPQ